MKIEQYQRAEQPESLPDVRQRLEAGPENFVGGAQAAASAGLDQAAGQVNRTTAELFADQQQAMYAARAQDGRNQTQQFVNGLLYDPQSGLLNLQGAEAFAPGADGSPPRNAAMQQLKQHIGEVADSLGNEASRQRYLDWANAQAVQVDGLLQQHEGQQARVYQRGVNQAVFGANQETMRVNNNNPDLLAEQADGIAAAAANQARLEGMPPAWGQALARQHISAGLKGAIDTALSQGNHPAALQVLKRFAPQMQTADLLQAHQAITHAEQAQAAQHISNQVLGHFLPMMQTAPQDQAFNLLMTAESGGRQFADDGAVLTSGKGAKGKAQLMPETGPEAAKLAGLPWQPALFNRGKTGDAAKDAEAEQYNFALGHAYFNQQLRDFKGDMGLAFAAYNAGPGTVRQALQQSAQQGGNWLSYLPKETQTYVSGKLQAFAVGEGQFPQPSLEQVLAAADRHIQTTYGDTATPQLHQQVLEQVTQQFEQHKQTIKQANDAGVAEAYRQLQLNGGQFAALPVAVRNAIPADKVDDVMGFARRISQGQEPQTDWALYYQLRTHRPLLKSTNLLALKDRLGDTEFKQLVNLQQTQAAPGSHSTSVRTAADILHSFMAQAGIDPVPRADDREQAATVGKIWSAYEQRVADFEALNGRKASTQDLEKVAAQLFTRVPVSSWLHGTEEKLGILLDKDKDQVVVPASDRQQIVQALRQTFPDRPVTEQDIVYAYLRGKGLM